MPRLTRLTRLTRLPRHSSLLVMIALWSGLLASGLPAGAHASQTDTAIHLAHHKQTAYAIVKPQAPSDVDDYAVEQLQQLLAQMTGATFKVIEPDQVQNDGRYIFVGLSSPMQQRLENNQPPAELPPEHFVSRSLGQDIFLYGNNRTGNLNAIFTFLEQQMGWRWFSVLAKPVLPKQDDVTLRPFHYTHRFSYQYRELPLPYSNDFFFQHAINMGFTHRKRVGVFQSDLPTTAFTHTSFSYIPPEASSRYAKRFAWQDKADYFATNPDYYSLDKTGKRVTTMQLCYGNPELRKELTRNVLRDIAYHQEKGWDHFYVTIDAADVPGRMCYCDICQALEKKFNSPGGPIIDYLLELANLLKTTHPHVLLKTHAYRRTQLQIPPTLPDGGMLPDNLIVSLAPVEDSYFADWWNHPQADVQETYQHLQQWKKITHHLWAWFYSNPWGTGFHMPIGNIERTINNFRMMSYAGVQGVFTDSGLNFHYRANFAELHRYLIIKLMQDVNQDTDKIIREFTDNYYGRGGSVMRVYLRELEEGRINMTLPADVRVASQFFDLKTFPYLTAVNIHRWQGYFDQMESAVTDEPDALLNIQAERRTLDLATLWQWTDLKKEYPDAYTDHTIVASRIKQTDAKIVASHPQMRAIGDHVLDDFVLTIEQAGKVAPLPPELAEIDPSRIRQVVPMRHRNGSRYEKDPDAAFGYAALVDDPNGLSFSMGLHHMDTKVRVSHIKPGKENIKPGQYTLYDLGEVTLTPKTWAYFGRSWQTRFDLGQRFYMIETSNQWRVYASLKFTGDSYAGDGKPDAVYCDRVILVAPQQESPR